MIKMYRHQGDLWEYAEAWVEQPIGYLHYGTLGQMGITNEYPVNATEEKAFLEYYRDSFLEQGYTVFPVEEQSWIAIQYPMVQQSSIARTQEDIQLESSITTALNEALGWTGLGHVDGWDAGHWSHPTRQGMVQNIYCLVVNQTLALPIILAALKRLGFLRPDCSIGARQNTDDTAYEWVFGLPTGDNTFYL